MFLSFLIINLCIAGQLVMAKDSVNTTQDLTDLSEQYLLLILEALKNHDSTLIYNVSVDELKIAYDQNNKLNESLYYIWNERNWIDYKKIDQSIRQSQGDMPSATLYSYEVITEKDSMEVYFSIVDRSGKIDWISLGSKEIGTLKTWRQFNLGQWLFLLFAVLEFLFSIHTAYLCVKYKTKYRTIWLIFIMSVYTGVRLFIVEAGNINISFFIYTFSFPRILSYQGAISEIQISVPIGAIIYYIKHIYDKKSRGR